MKYKVKEQIFVYKIKLNQRTETRKQNSRSLLLLCYIHWIEIHLIGLIHWISYPPFVQPVPVEYLLPANVSDAWLLALTNCSWNRPWRTAFWDSVNTIARSDSLQLILIHDFSLFWPTNISLLEQKTLVQWICHLHLARMKILVKIAGYFLMIIARCYDKPHITYNVDF
jgi:hypothetical protein